MTLHILAELEQGSPEWHDQRRGMVTASVVGRLIAVGAPGALTILCPTCHAPADSPCLSAARKEPTPIKTIHDARTAAASSLPPVYETADNETSRALTATLATERISGWTEDTPMNSDMWRGVIHEPIAREKYAEHYGPVTEVGFMVRDDWGFEIGYSPDGLVGDDGLLEIKAPRGKTHLLTVLDDTVPVYNMAQLQAGLLVSGRAWVDFVPFVGGLPLWRKRVTPDPAWHRAIVAAVANFETNAAEMVAAYQQATNGLPMTERLDNELGLVF
jgi:hypothetical protein